MKRLFEAGTVEEWKLADRTPNLDVHQAINYLMRGENEIAKISASGLDRKAIHRKRNAINTLAWRRGMSVMTRLRDSHILIRNVTGKFQEQRKITGGLGRLSRFHYDKETQS